MKFLLLMVVLAVAYFLWRNKHGPQRTADDRPAARPALPEDMVRCPVCSVHLPRADAVPAANGLFYCSAEHRHSAGN